MQMSQAPPGRTPVSLDFLSDINAPPDTPIPVSPIAPGPTTPVDPTLLGPQPMPQPPMPLPPLPNLQPDDMDVIERRNPTIAIGNWDLDVDSAVIMAASIAIWVTIWRSSGLMATLSKEYIYFAIFTFFILYTIINMVTSGSKSGSVLYELNILLTVEQMVAILFGTVIVFVLFNDKLAIHPVSKQIINRIGFVIVILLSFASMWLNVVTSGRAFRAIRKGKQALYNIAYCLFLVIGLLAFQSSQPVSGNANAARS